MTGNVVAQRVHRILAKMERFSRPDPTGDDSPELPRESNEELLGCLRLTGANAFFSDRAVYISDPKILRVPYVEIADAVVTSGDSKGQRDTVILVLEDGSNVALKTAETSDRFNDCWELLRFFKRVIADLKHTW